MKMLQELLDINDQKTFEIAEIVKAFPNKKAAETHLRKLWGTPKLTYMGNVVLGGDGDVFDGLEKAADRVKEDFKFTVGDAEVVADEWSEVYLGYDPKTGYLWQGFDCWLDEEDFNRQMDKLKIEYDDSEPNGGKEFAEHFEEFKNARPYVILKMKSSNGRKFTIVDDISGNGQHGMFYPAGHKEMQSRGIIDLRLD